MSEPQTLLIVEDDPIIAMDMEWEFSDRGYEIIGVAATVAGAKEVLSKKQPDFAILDYNLGGATSTPVAQQLDRANIPFIYVTGRPDAVAKDEMAPDAPIICKPMNFDDIETLYIAG